MIKKIFNNIGTQLISLAVLLIVSVIFIIFYIGSRVNSLSEINSFHENLNTLTSSLVVLDIKLEEFKKHEHSTDFYETNRDESTVNFYDAFFSVFSVNKELMSFKYSKKYKVFDIFKQNEALLNDYEEKYKLLLKNTIEIGNDDFGYIQKLNHVEERLIENVKESPSLSLMFENIKNIKDSYLNSLNPLEAKEVLSKMLKFKKYAITTSENEINKKLIIDICAEYTNNFKHIYYLNKKQGKNSSIGLYSDLEEISGLLSINSTKAFDVSKFPIQQDYITFKRRLELIIVISALLMLFIIFLLYRVFRNELSKIKILSEKLLFEKDNFAIYDFSVFTDEVSKVLQKHEQNTNLKINAINDLASGNIKKKYSFNERDGLGLAIVNLQTKISEEIKKIEGETRKRVIEDKHKEGIAKFGRILRRHVGDINSLSYELISELIGFLDAEVGGIFVTEEKNDKKILKLRASYAYNEKKLIQKEIEFGEGLVGTCAIDKSTFFIDKVDDDYMKIVSGFGHTKPTSLIICPILVEEYVYGVIEIAATRMFNRYDIKFVEVLAEDIAYTLSYLLSLNQKETEIE